ncbi:MAG: universal stress protein [Myxococcales bacterium]|nr:universal stress protein [Myxococcota bacterium]MDW8281173.1 universal stress protein [Myxococcales bacterium]
MIPQHIVVATDLDETSMPALRLAVDLARPLGARITVLHVIEPIAMPPGLEAYALEGMPADWEQRVERGRFSAVEQRLEALLREHQGSGVPLSAKVVAGLLPGALTEAAEEMGADLLVLGTHGRSGVAHFLLGSVAEKVVRTAPCPVLTVRPR